MDQLQPLCGGLPSVVAQRRRGRERVTLSPTVWPVSWPLPATTRTSPGSEHGARAARIASPRSPISLRARRAGQDLGADRGRVLRARIVVGDDGHVGQLGGDLAHQRALAPVPVAAGAEHHDQPAARVRPQRRRAPSPGRPACGRSRHRPRRRAAAPTRCSRPGAPSSLRAPAKHCADVLAGRRCTGPRRPARWRPGRRRPAAGARRSRRPSARTFSRWPSAAAGARRSAAGPGRLADGDDASGPRHRGGGEDRRRRSRRSAPPSRRAAAASRTGAAWPPGRRPWCRGSRGGPVRLGKPAAASRTPSSRRWSMPCDEASMREVGDALRGSSPAAGAG